MTRGTTVSTSSFKGKAQITRMSFCSKQQNALTQSAERRAGLGLGGRPAHRGFTHPSPRHHRDPRSSHAKQLPSSNPMSQTLPVSTGIYFQPSRFLSICSRNPLAIPCPDGRLQMKGMGSWRVFSWPASQQPAGT